MEKYQLSRVFGVSREKPLTYVERNNVDDKFKKNLARDKHIVIYGRSKQGKTCLHRNCLEEENYIVIQCRSSMLLTDLYATILKEAGAKIDISEKKTTSGAFKVGIELAASGKIPFLAKGEAKSNFEGEQNSSTEKEKKYIEIDPDDPNDIIRILEAMQFSKYIMLEDFHYLSKEVQCQVAIDLKAFHEKSSKCCFIIVGVWLEPNRLLLYNGDLSGRLIPIDADRWEDSDLSKILSKGEELLNIKFSDTVKAAIITSCQKNVGILQETCWRLCQNYNITETQDKIISLNNDEEVDNIIKEIANDQAGRYQNLLFFLADKNNNLDENELVKWIAFVVITATPQELILGISFQTISKRIREHHPNSLIFKDSNIYNALRKLTDIQNDNKVQPLVLDYDFNSNILRIVSSEFILYTEAISEKELIKWIDL
jgi:hypothetical protein